MSPDSMLLHRVFVYGTLKRGQPNSHLLAAAAAGRAEFVGTGRTIDRFPLVVASRYNIPFILPIENAGHRISGEIYDVDDTKLKILDELEGYPEFYTRKQVPIEAAGGQLSAWMYILRTFDSRFEKTMTPYLEEYFDGVQDRHYNRHENCESNEDLF